MTRLHHVNLGVPPDGADASIQSAPKVDFARPA